MSWGQPPGPYGPPPQGYGPPGYGPPPSYPMHPGPQPGMWRCPFCGSTLPPAEAEKIQQGGWVLFVVLLFLCFIFCWIPLVTMKDIERRCRSCGSKVG